MLLLARVDEPALLRRLFELACRYAGQVHTTTLAHYLQLLAGAGMLTGLPKFAGDTVRVRASNQKLHVLNTGLCTALAGYTFEEARADREYSGPLVESAIEAHLANAAMVGECELFYWRERNRVVDFTVHAGRRLVAIEVNSGRASDAVPGRQTFAAAFRPRRKLLVGSDGIPVEEFRMRPASYWIGS